MFLNRFLARIRRHPTKNTSREIKHQEPISEALSPKKYNKSDNRNPSLNANKSKKSSLISYQKSRKNEFIKLITDLHNIALDYGIELTNLSLHKQPVTDLDITYLIRKECRIARSAELPALSLKIINRALQYEEDSPWLIHDKALSLSIMGQDQKALKLFRQLKKTTKKEKLLSSINENIKDIQQNHLNYRSKANFFLVKQTKSIALANDLDATFLPKSIEVSKKTRVKFVILREARSILTTNTKACLKLANSTLDYFPGNRPALLLKGEALALLEKTEQALEIWENLSISHDKTIARKASDLISKDLVKKAVKISAAGNHKDAIMYFQQQHLKRNIIPVADEEINKILRQIESPDTRFSDPELHQHHLKFQFNTLLIGCLEKLLHEQGHLSADSPAQKPGAISKTALKAG